MTLYAGSSRRVFRSVILGLVVVGLALGSMDPAIGWVIPLALGGGGLTAAALLAIRSRQAHASFAPDSFERSNPFDVMNISRVRVAGVGGVGLLLVAFLVALQFELTTAALAAGVIGGTIVGVVMILYRRRHGMRLGAPGQLL